MNITPKQYKEGILDICDSLVTDLLYFLKDEGRYKFRMIKYMDKIIKVFDAIHNEENIEINERVIYVAHKSIFQEYKKLRSKKLSPADCVICIILKLISIAEEISELDPRIEKVRTLLQGFYDNIKNRGKTWRLKKMTSLLHNAIENQTWGKLRLEDIDLYQLEHPTPKTQEITGEEKTWELDNKEEEINL